MVFFLSCEKYCDDNVYVDVDEILVWVVKIFRLFNWDYVVLRGRGYGLSLFFFFVFYLWFLFCLCF